MKNIERLNGIIDWLESDEERLLFVMDRFVDTPYDASEENNWCGTSCCIAGYTLINYGGFKSKDIPEFFFQEAMKLLELNDKEARALFYCKTMDGESLFVQLNSITRQQAAQAVRNLIDFGDPKWEVICGPNFF